MIELVALAVTVGLGLITTTVEIDTGVHVPDEGVTK